MLKSFVAGIGIFLAGLFGTHQVQPAAPVPTYPPAAHVAIQEAPGTAHPTVPAATPLTSQPTTIINQPVIERIIERAMPAVFSGVTKSELDARLQELTGRISTRLAGIAAANTAAPNNFVTVPVFAQAERIDNLANVSISNATVHGVSGLTASDIPSLPYLSTSGGMLTGDVSLTNATSTNFFATLGHFTTGIIDSLTAAAATVTNLIATTITGTNATFTNATTTNATSTNFFATTASSTNLFAQTASLGGLTANTINVTGGLVNVGSAFNAFGDSITVGVGASSQSTTAYVPLLAAAKHWTATNHGVSGSQAIDQGTYVYPITISSSTISTLMVGTNDQRIYLTDTNKLQVFQSAHRAIIAWLAIPSTNKVLGTSSSVAYTGTWANTAVYGIGKYSIVSGSSATFTVYGKNILISMIQQNGKAGTFTVSIDGVSQGSFVSGPANGTTVTTANSGTYGPKLFVFPNVGDGQHTVVITTTNNDYNYFDWAAGTGGTTLYNGPTVYVGNIPRYSAAGYSTYGGSDANIATFNRVIENNVAQLASMGLNVVLADVSGLVTPTTDLGSDGLHPNDTGHAHIKDAFLNVANSILYARDRQNAQMPIPNIKWDLSNIAFWTQNGATWAERARIDTSGNLGVGTTSPAALLSVGGNLFVGASTAGGTNGNGIFMGKVGIGTAAPGASFDIQNGNASAGPLALNIGGDVNALTRTDNTRKIGIITSSPYAVAASPTTIITVDNSGTDNILAIGGGNISSNAVTSLRFYTATNITTTSGTERMRINSNGNVGIGTTTPWAKLSVAALSSNTAPLFTISTSTASATSTAFLIDQNGLVGIGTSSPTTALQINGSITPNIDNTYTDGNATYRWNAVYATNNVIQTSDARLKENVTNLSYGLADILKLRPVSFTWIAQPQQGTKLGFIAQEVQPIIPETVNVGDDANHTLGLTYTEFIPVIVHAIQQLEQKITDFADSFTTKELTFTRATGDELDARRVVADELCAKKSDGTNVCVTGDQLAAAISGASVSPPASSSAPSSSPDTTPPTITITGNNPAHIQVGDSYADLGASVTDNVDQNLGLKYFLNGALVSNIVIDTSVAATDTIDYVAADSAGNTSTSTRTVIVESPVTAEPAPTL